MGYFWAKSVIAVAERLKEGGRVLSLFPTVGISLPEKMYRQRSR